MTGGSASVRVAAAGLVLLALIFGVGSFQLGFRHEGVPGPGLLPLLTSVLLLPIAGRLLLRPSLLPSAAPLRAAPLLALAVLGVYGAALPYGGFAVPTFVLLVFWVVAFHRRPLRHAVVLAVLLSAGAVALFHLLLGVPMPLWPWRG
jgi:hypothetical protein